MNPFNTETLKHTIMSKITPNQTGNPIFDMILTGFILSVITSIMSPLNINLVKNFFRNLLTKWKTSNKCSIELSMVRKDTDFHTSQKCSDELRALLWWIMINLKDTPSVQAVKIVEFSSANLYDKMPRKTNYMLNQDEYFDLAGYDSIVCYATESKSNDDEKKRFSLTETKITMSSNTLSLPEIKFALDDIVIKFRKWAAEKTKDKQFLYRKNGIDDDGISLFRMCKMPLFKGFNTIFFPQKEEFLSQVNYFMNNETEYIKKGIPYNLGVLLYGTPGCGKSAIIQALAKMTGRDVLSLNLNDIVNSMELLNLDLPRVGGNGSLSLEDYIIVLEEADTFIAIRDRKKYANTQKQEAKTKDQVSEEFMTRIAKSLPDIEGPKVKKQTLTLGDVLNWLDGDLGGKHGRFVIMTTNDIESIDPAIIRDGRFHLKTFLTYSTMPCMKQQLCCFYENDKEKINHFFEQNTCPLKRLTPAEIQGLCIKYSTNIDKLLHMLVE